MAAKARIVDFEEARSSSAKRARATKSSSSRSTRSSQGSTRRSSNRRGSAQTPVRMSSKPLPESSSKSSKSSKKKASSSKSQPLRGDAQRARSAQERSSSARTRKTDVSFYEKAKRAFLKKKAELSFARTVAADAPESADAPRAALYKGEMGSSHKKATKMQSGQTHVGLKLGNFKLGRKATVALMVCTCLVVGCALLYVPTKNYYTAVRDRAKAEVAYEIVTTRNEALVKDVALLSTDAGMEDRVREQYGWVKQGENSVSVTGLENETEPSAAEILRTVTLNDIHAPETWYSPVLDPIFGYAD